MQLGDLATWSAAVIAAIAIVFSYLAHREARASRKSNDKWQAINAEAAVRSANAAEQALALQQASTEPITPTPHADVEWELERPGKGRFVLRNTGNDVATGVTIDPDQFQGFARQLPKDAAVRPRASVEFLASPSMGFRIPNEVWVSWDGVNQPVAVPIPEWY
jgi:type II secretory pathway pseudopilin PulG